MGERTGYAPGVFCWTDLATSDAEGAERFYAGLFGWEAEALPLPEGGAYVMLRKDGRDACALYTARDGQPSAWLSYVSVTEAGAAAERARELGGAVLQDAFDVLDAGRMALLHDPAGAVFAVWEPRRHFGAAIVNAPGALSLNQLNTSDPEAAGRFYAELFGWRIERAPVEGMDYWGAYAGETLNAGMMPLPPDLGAPSHWLVYFGSEDTEADARRIGELGGTVLIPSTEVPGGTFVVAQDPQGAAFALFAGRFDP